MNFQRKEKLSVVLLPCTNRAEVAICQRKIGSHIEERKEWSSLVFRASKDSQNVQVFFTSFSDGLCYNQP